MLRKILRNFSLISSIMLRKLRLRQKNGFLIKKRVCLFFENIKKY